MENIPFALEEVFNQLTGVVALRAEQQRPLLLVDDNLIALRILTHLIGQRGLKVDTAQSAADALARVTAGEAPNYLACLIDWHMPTVDGIETMQHLRTAYAARNQKAPPMLLVTAYSHQAEINTVSQQIDGLVAKPVSARHLYIELARCLGILQDERPAVDWRKDKRMQWVRFRHLDILLVEDIEINQEVILELLANVGLTASLARNGVEALDAVAKKRPDLILMDCQMPVMDGYTATRKLREQAAYQNLPIIALTANATVTDQEKCFEVGMNAHVAKPIRMDDLYERMVQCLPGGVSPAPPSSQATTVPNDSSNAAVLPEFPGIDLAVGLAHVDGKRPLLLRGCLEIPVRELT